MKRLAAYTVVAVLGTAIVGPPTARAQGRAWLDQPAQMTNADMLSLLSGLITISATAELLSTGGDDFKRMEVVLADKDGRTHINLLANRKFIASIQNQPPGPQTMALKIVARMMAKMLVKVADEASKAKQGIFGTIEVRHSAIDKALVTFFKGRTADKIVVSIGYPDVRASSEKVHLYATVADGRVDFNPSAPPIPSAARQRTNRPATPTSRPAGRR